MSQNPYQATTHRPKKKSSRKKVKAVATNQKYILYCILANIVTYLSAFFLPPTLVVITSFIFLFTAVASVVFVIRLAQALGKGNASYLYGIMMLVPCLSLLMLLIINSEATKYLTKKGLKVGLLGADISRL